MFGYPHDYGNPLILVMSGGPKSLDRLCWNILQETPMFHRLVGARATPLKNMKVNWDDYSQDIILYGKIENVPNHQPVGKSMVSCVSLKPIH